MKILDIKGYQQSTDYTCGLSAIMSLLNYYGAIKDLQMNHQTELQIAKNKWALMMIMVLRNKLLGGLINMVLK